jgi:methylmalonyl-CoA mutase
MGLFEAFDTVSHKDWLDKITTDLKGKDYNETLVWNSDEGIAVQPFYNSSSVAPTPLKKHNNWKIRETINIQSIENANQKALLALKGGANSILFIGEIKDQSEMDALLQDIQIDIIELHFYNSNPKHTSELINLNQGSISYDCLNEINIEELANITSSTGDIKTITVKSIKHSSIIQELAFSLSQGVEYFNLLTDKGIEANIIASKIQFTFGVGTNYFFEIAKIRAARKLWQLILEQYKVEDTSMVIHSETSVEKISEEDGNYDILRNTSKAMSAIIGGCDSLTVLPHDNTESTIDFSNRIARNIQHILKEEAFFSKVNNPADGAYYIEELTDKLANKAWGLFQEMEKKGGFLTCLENGIINNKNLTT